MFLSHFNSIRKIHKSSKYLFIPLFLLFFLSILSIARAFDKEAFEKAPLQVEAKKMDGEIGKYLTLYGNAVVKKKDMCIKADRIDIIYGSSKKKFIEKVLAKGHVEFYGGEGRKAFSDEAIFSGDKVVLSGKPRVIQGKNIVKGNRITYYIKENKFVVEGKEGEEVKAIIYPEEIKKVTEEIKKERSK